MTDKSATSHDPVAPSPETGAAPDRSHRVEAIASRLSRRPEWWQGFAVFIVVTGVSFLQGGYFPTERGWATLAVLWALLLVILLNERLGPGRLGFVALCGLGGLTVWTAASIIWSSSPARSVLEVQRVVLYLTAGAALLLVARRRSVPSLVGGLLAAITVVCTYALATRLVPAWGEYDALTNYRLSEPLGYWNALGIFAGIGVVLALGAVARASPVMLRVLAAAAVVPLTATWYFTFSRGAWIAIGIGVVAWLVIDPKRLQALAAIVAAGAPAVIGIALASRADALTTVGAAEHDASSQGRTLVLALVALAALALALALALAWGERRIDLGDHRRRIANWAVGGCAVILISVGFAVGGGPEATFRAGYDRFTAPPTATGPDLGGRLLDLSSNGRTDLWKVAWGGFTTHPLGGAGAGTYEQRWFRDRPQPQQVRDAHSLYLETLSELGIVGLLLLVTVGGAAVAAAVLSRGQPWIPPIAGAFVAFAVHAGADWDWEIAALTLSALVLVAALVGSRVDDEHGWEVVTGHRVIAVPVVVAVGIVVTLAMIGNSAIASGNDAIGDGDWEAAASAGRSAMTFAPWSPQPWQVLGRAQMGEGNLAEARRSLGVAISKESNDWELWLDLAQASSGEARRHAFLQARRLNPRGPEVTAFGETFAIS